MAFKYDFHSRSRSQNSGMGWAIPVPISNSRSLLHQHPSSQSSKFHKIKLGMTYSCCETPPSIWVRQDQPGHIFDHLSRQMGILADSWQTASIKLSSWSFLCTACFTWVYALSVNAAACFTWDNGAAAVTDSVSRHLGAAWQKLTAISLSIFVNLCN